MSSGNQHNTKMNHNHDQCLKIIAPDISLLRNHKLAHYIFKDNTGSTVLNRVIVEALMLNSTNQSNHDSLQFVYLCDQYRHMIPGNQQFISITELSGMHTVLSYAKLCKLHKHVLQASYYAPLSNKSS